MNSKPEGILIWGELNENKEIMPVVFELLSKAKELSKKLDNCSISIITCGYNIDIEKYKTELTKYGANELVFIENEKLESYNTRNYALSTLNYIKNNPKEIFLLGATKQGRDLAPQISSALNTGLTADCTGLDITEDKKLAATRPTFGGELMATILCKTYPQMATVRPNIFKTSTCDTNGDMVITHYNPDITYSSLKKVINSYNKVRNQNELENAKIIIAGGKGLKNKENFEKLFELAKHLNAHVGATRKAVDSGFISSEYQIGQTGKVVSPDLYIGLGISGAIQHITGITNAKKIIAINTDKTAPITKIADETIIADASTILNEWLALF